MEYDQQFGSGVASADLPGEQLAEEAASLTDSLREFVATASHELRAPLAVIVGYASLLEERGPQLSAEKRAAYAAAIHRAGVNATRLVGDLLTWSTIEVGTIAAAPEAVDVRDAIDEACAAVQGTVDVVCADSTTAWVDRQHLVRILANYLSNAAAYGRLPAFISAAPAAGGIEIRVEDSGAGVPAAMVEGLFGRFGAGGSAHAGGGNGLGLSIVKGLAEANGGRVFYEACPSGGARFGVWLPVKARTAVAS